MIYFLWPAPIIIIVKKTAFVNASSGLSLKGAIICQAYIGCICFKINKL
jgi:hypothetical protein